MAGKREEQLKEITERLDQGVKGFIYIGKIHGIPENDVAVPYKKFNRQVKSGEKGIKIIAPVPIREKEEVEKFDRETNEPVLRPDGQPETEEVEHIIPRFRVATVFDISQTYGDPLPELDTPELMGSVENFEIFMEARSAWYPRLPCAMQRLKGNQRGITAIQIRKS